MKHWLGTDAGFVLWEDVRRIETVHRYDLSWEVRLITELTRWGSPPKLTRTFPTEADAKKEVLTIIEKFEDAVY